MSSHPADITFMFGKKYGRLTVIKEAERVKSLRTVYCVCECGNSKSIYWHSVLHGVTKSCGCYNTRKGRPGNPTHKLSKHPLYTAYFNMKSRCYNKKNWQYHRYGGRGITVCPEWLNNVELYISFCISAGWKDGLEIDRRDNNGNYCPDNCRVATDKINANNTSRNVSVIYKGEKMKLSAFYDTLPGLTNKILYNRIFRRHWDVERAVTQKVRISPKRNRKW